MSDDSHHVDHIGFGYARALEYLERLGIERLSCLAELSQSREPGERLQSCDFLIKDLWHEPFFAEKPRAVV